MKVTSGRIMMRIAMDEYQIWKTNIPKASFTLAVIGPVIQKAVVSERMLKTVIVRSDYEPRFHRFIDSSTNDDKLINIAWDTVNLGETATGLAMADLYSKHTLP